MFFEFCFVALRRVVLWHDMESVDELDGCMYLIGFFFVWLCRYFVNWICISSFIFFRFR